MNGDARGIAVIVFESDHSIHREQSTKQIMATGTSSQPGRREAQRPMTLYIEPGCHGNSADDGTNVRFRDEPLHSEIFYAIGDITLGRVIECRYADAGYSVAPLTAVPFGVFAVGLV